MFTKPIAAVCLLAMAGLAVAAAPDLNNPTGTRGLILIDKIGRHIRFFDPSALKELSNFEVGPAPHDLAISPDHRTAYVPIYGDGVYGRNPHPGHIIEIIDLNTYKVTGTIDVSPYQAPHGIQIDRHGTLYVTCDLSRKLLVIDPKARKIQAAIDTDGTGHWVAALPDASKAYIANKNDRPFISVIDLKAKKMIGKVPMPNGTQGIAESPDGKRIVAVDFRDPTLAVIDTKTDKVVERIPLEGNTRAAFKPRFTPDGRKILVCSTSGGSVNIIDASNLHGKQVVLKVGKAPMGFAISADGKTALVANHGDGTVSVIDLNAERIVNTFKGGTGIETLAYY
ncbi:MAG TPA: cytochrome D1 domain-containing protein [Bryobacteraceae bacterium]|nr:cytochrome D1 domain-containing protein [Bryobacteraceae bacterium]